MKTRIKRRIKHALPKPIFNLLTYQRELARVRMLRAIPGDLDRLARVGKAELAGLFGSDTLEREWGELERRLKAFGLWNVAGATGSNDLRALYSLARHGRFRSVLEVGTHIGGSAVTLAFALKQLASDGEGSDCGLTTVDVIDVNDPSDGPWIHAGLGRPPLEIMRELDLHEFVTFVNSSSIDFLERGDHRFDFVYLDGDHAANTVYREIMLAADRLNTGGVIALHDYCSNIVVSTYDDGWTIPGPYLAARRVSAEHPDVAVHPVEELPWTAARPASHLAVLGRL